MSHQPSRTGALASVCRGGKGSDRGEAPGEPAKEGVIDVAVTIGWWTCFRLKRWRAVRPRVVR